MTCDKKYFFLGNHTISQQADYISEYLPDDETFESKAVAGTNTRIMLEVFGAQLRTFEQYLNTFTSEMDPSCATHLLPEWERALGIPDDCFQATASLSDRQRNALIKLSKMNVQTNADFQRLASAFGIFATIQSGIDYVASGGTPFPGGDHEARFTIVISFSGGEPSTFPFTFPIVFGSSILGLLECIFAKVKPANCNVIFFQGVSALGDYYYPMDDTD